MSAPHVVSVASLLLAAACGYVIGAWRHSPVARDLRKERDLALIQSAARGEWITRETNR